MGQSNGCTTTQCCTARSPCGPRPDEFADKAERGKKPDVYTTAGVVDKDPLLGRPQRHWLPNLSLLAPSPISEEASKWDPVSGNLHTSCEELPEKRSDGANAEDCLQFQLFHPPLPPPTEEPPGNSLQMPPATEAPLTNSGGASLIDCEAQRRIDSSVMEADHKRTLRFKEDVEAQNVQLPSLDEEQQLNDREEGNPADDGKQVQESKLGTSSNTSNRSGKKKVTSFVNPASPGTEEEGVGAEETHTAIAEECRTGTAIEEQASQNEWYADLREGRASQNESGQVLAKLGVEEAPTQPKRKSMVRSLFNRKSNSTPAKPPMDNVSPARCAVPSRTNGHPVRSSMFSPVRGAESKPLPVS